MMMPLPVLLRLSSSRIKVWVIIGVVRKIALKYYKSYLLTTGIELVVCWILIIVFEEVTLPDFLQSFDLKLWWIAFNILRFEEGN
jgi:hypothetical protein